MVKPKALIFCLYTCHISSKIYICIFFLHINLRTLLVLTIVCIFCHFEHAIFLCFVYIKFLCIISYHFSRPHEEEVIKAQSNEKAVFIQMDANSKLGAHMIEGDPHGQSENGKILAGIIQRNALHVVNNSKTKCIGKITRRRITRKKKEESIIDFVLGCDAMYDMIEELVIDEKKEVALASFKKTKNGLKTKESDHNTLVTKVKSVWKKKRTEKQIEMYKLKDIEGIKKFKEITSKDNFLSSVFETEGSIEVQTKKFLKKTWILHKHML